MTMDTHVVRRRHARKAWLCSEEWAHDRTIHPGDPYCEVTLFHSEPSRDVALLRLCDYCGRAVYPEYETLAAGAPKVAGQTQFDLFTPPEEETDEPDS
jgi:hypothetical protein